MKISDLGSGCLHTHFLPRRPQRQSGQCGLLPLLLVTQDNVQFGVREWINQSWTDLRLFFWRVFFGGWVVLQRLLGKKRHQQSYCWIHRPQHGFVRQDLQQWRSRDETVYEATNRVLSLIWSLCYRSKFMLGTGSMAKTTNGRSQSPKK